MKKFFCAIFLIALAHALKQFRLSSVGFKQLTTNDTIVSTFGTFRIKLLTNGCTLSIENFNSTTDKYVEKGKYTSETFSGSCQYLNITNGKIVTENGNTYLQVINKAYNHSTTFTIDDEGVIRLIGTYISPNQVDIISKQVKIETFKTENKYMKAFSEQKVTFMSRYEAISNERKWKFIAEFGQLTIYYGEDPGKKIDYVYSSITIRDSRIYDFANKTFPGVIYNNITFQPRCSEPKIYLEFKAPFVFVADPYWPIVSVYDQGGYRIIEIAYFNIQQFDFTQDIKEINYHHFSSPCPRRTFQHKGECISNCPAPYYHQIKGQTGKCVLMCQQFSIINEQKRICSCVTDYEFPKLSTSDLVIQCPRGSIKTPYGCQCKTEGLFYDPLFSFTCVKQCPDATFAMNGLCMQCPQHCQACQRDNFNRLFLQCIECEQGYHMYKAQCVKDCINNYGFSQINGKCQKCEDVNCVDCSNDPKVCLKCNILTTLSNGTCKNNCTFPARQVYSEYFSTQCLTPPTARPPLMCTEYIGSHYKSKPFLKCDFCITGIAHLDTCVQTCPTGYYSHNNKYCACDGVKNMTIYDECLATKACPITMSFDIRSHSCLSCPFGCMSCINTQCTSCNPGYFLYISPQSILCRRKSPLFPCDQQYSWQRDNVCLVTDFANPTLQMTGCVANIANCSVCIPGSNQICVLCKEDFYIYNNTCIEQCPETMIPYENTCILPEIQLCDVPHLQSTHQQAIITLQKIKASKPYGHYIYDDKQSANDPVGYIPVFQELSTRKNDGVPRDTQFFQVEWVCLKCQQGYGLSNDFKSCLPCPSVCRSRLCYMARDDSCLSKNQQTPQGNCTKNQFTDSETGKCLQSCNDPNKYPQIEQNKLYCKPATNSATKGYLRIDSAIYKQSDGSNLAFFVFSQKVSSNNELLPIRYLGGLKKQKSSRQLQATNDTNSPPSELIVQDGGYLMINQSDYDETYNAYELDLSDKLTSLQGVEDSYIFPNKIYGTLATNDHPKFIKYWLAYIGYIMSIVILLLHFVYIGNQLIYKVDNLLIFVQSIFYFSFARNLVGRLVSQFYYGWFFAHAGFLPNLFKDTIPDYYAELAAPQSFKIVNYDGNYFRNAGFSLAWLLIYMGCCLLVILGVWLLLFRVMQKKQTWYPRIARQAFLGGVQFFSMNLMFFSVTQLQYGDKYPMGEQKYHEASQALSIVSIVVLCLYTVIRFLFHHLGGIYMGKRLLIAVFLALSYQKTIYLLPIILIQVSFAVLRYVLEGPEQKLNKITIFGQGLIFILCYILLFLSLDAGVNSLILSIVIFIFIVYLAYDLTTIYLESRDQYPEDQLIQIEEEERNVKAAERVSGANFSRRHSMLNYGHGESAVVV